jgi:hypothetical protein
MIAWVSHDQGATWSIVNRLTEASRYNHTYARKPVNASPEFYTLWADGSPLEPTPSSIYFATRDGKVFRLPERMSAATAKPERIR